MKPTTLLLKSLTGKLTEQEEKVFKEWLQQSIGNRELFDKIKSLKESGTDISEFEFWDSEKAWANIIREYDTKSLRKSRSRNFAHLLKYAAVFVGIAILGYGYYKYNNTEIPLSNIHKPNTITLELDNGEIRVLSEEDTYAITTKNGAVLGTKNGTRLDYTSDKPADELVYNTLKVPYGKRFEVALSDATVVYLNAGSSLRYPIRFLEDTERQVFLTGEAYFNVAKDKANKFIVTTAEMDVTVFGTKFNLSAYPEDKYVNTVLVEGSVGISSATANERNDNHIQQLKPGYKAEWDTDTGKTVFDKVDTDIFTGWIEGRLVMKNLSFENIIKKLERHYDVVIINNYTELNKEVFTASFDIESIQEVLASFSENRAFKFQTDNQTIIINKP